jgi:hypothetical protein
MVPEALHSVKADDPKLEKDFRQKAFDIIMDRSDTLDPMSFSTRTFQDILFALNSNYELEKMDDANEDFSRVLGSPKDFERVVVTELNKAIVVDDNYFEKAVFVEEIDKLTDEQKKGYRELYKKNPKKFAKLFGLDIIEILDGKKEAIDKSKKKNKTDSEKYDAYCSNCRFYHASDPSAQCPTGDGRRSRWGVGGSLRSKRSCLASPLE